MPPDGRALTPFEPGQNATRPDLEVILITGFAQPGRSGGGHQARGPSIILPSPSPRSSLREVVMRALEQKTPCMSKGTRREFAGPGAGDNRPQPQKSGRSRRRSGTSPPTDCKRAHNRRVGHGQGALRQGHPRPQPPGQGPLRGPSTVGPFTEELIANELFGHEKDRLHRGPPAARPGFLEASSGGHPVFWTRSGRLPLFHAGQAA